MVVRVLVVLMIVCVGISQPNHQQRVIYYSEEDNACSFGTESDSINLVINIDNHYTIKGNMKGNTLC